MNKKLFLTLRLTNYVGHHNHKKKIKKIAPLQHENVDYVSYTDCTIIEQSII